MRSTSAYFPKNSKEYIGNTPITAGQASCLIMTRALSFLDSVRDCIVCHGELYPWDIIWSSRLRRFLPAVGKWFRQLVTGWGREEERRVGV